MPASTDVGKNYREMRRNHPDWPEAKLRAAALNMARGAGADIPKPRGKKEAGEGAGTGEEGTGASPPPWDGEWDEDELWEQWGKDTAEAIAAGSFVTATAQAVTQAVRDLIASAAPPAALPTTAADPPALFAQSKALADGNRLAYTKDADGRARLTFWVSNNFRDRDNPPEILSAQAHQHFVQWAAAKEFHPEAWLWHTPGTRWGEVDWMDYADGFLIESVVVDAGKEALAASLAADPDTRVSHGYVIPAGGRDAQDWSVINRYYQYEISPLPAGKEANPLTGTASASASVSPWDLTPLLTGVHATGTGTESNESLKEAPPMPMDTAKRTWLEGKLGKEKVAELERATLDLAGIAKSLGLESKDLAAAFEPGAPEEDKPAAPATGPNDPEPTPVDPAPAAPALDVEALTKAIESRLQLGALNDLLGSFASRLERVEQSQSKALGDAIRPPAGDTVAYLWGKRPSADPANLLTKEQSDALGAPADDSGSLPPHMRAVESLVFSPAAGSNGHSGPGDVLSH